MQANYTLYFHEAVAFATLALVVFLTVILSSDGPKAGPALFVIVVGFPWLAIGGALSGKIAFEDWLVRCGASRGATPGHPVAPTSTPRQIVAAHKKKTIELQTIGVIGGIGAAILVAMLVLFLTWLSRR